MVRNKLDFLYTETQKYLGIPYFSNFGRHRLISADNVLVGKGDCLDIAQKTIELANQKMVKLSDLSSAQIYNFQKKHHLGIDCSALACHLLIFWANQNNKLVFIDVRKTSANMLTSSPFSQKIDPNKATTGDLVRQKNGHHVLFVLNKSKNIITYIHSSRQSRGVVIDNFSLKSPNIKIDGVFRPSFLLD